MSTLKVDTILKRTGTGTITVGQSGDTIDFPTGTTISGSGANTPAFQANAGIGIGKAIAMAIVFG